MKLIGIELAYEGGTESFLASGSNEALTWSVHNLEAGFYLTLHAAREVALRSVKATFSFAFHEDDRLFVNGYQSWTDSHEHTVHDRLHSLDRLPKALVKKFDFNRYGDYDFVTYGKKPGQLHGFTYAYVRRGEEYILFASLAEESGYTVIRFDASAGTVTLEKDCAGHHFTGEYPVFDLAILTGSETVVFDRYFELIGAPKPRGRRIAGYTSWYNLYENISEASVLRDLAGFASAEKVPDVFQIDDGYETAVGDWLSVDPAKFPNGLAPCAEKIREAGMTPGLWLAPFAAEKESALVREHPDWLLRDEDGAPVTGGSNWSGFYGLDIYNEEFRAYLTQVFDTVIRQWGFPFVKLDFLYACSIVPRKDRTRAQVMFDGMRWLRELCGQAAILGCGVPLAPAFGLADYCRIGCDVSLDWDNVWYMRQFHRERTSTKNSLLNTVFRRQLDGRAFRNDPDVYLLRDDNIKLDSAQKKTLATINALFGGVLFTSDNVAAYSEESRRLYEETAVLSPADVTGVTFENGIVTVRFTHAGKPGEVSIRV